jgi:hypothetical protein
LGRGDYSKILGRIDNWFGRCDLTEGHICSDLTEEKVHICSDLTEERVHICSDLTEEKGLREETTGGGQQAEKKSLAAEKDAAMRWAVPD